MLEKLEAPISVYSSYDHKRKVFTPVLILWDGEKYKVTKIGYHHKFRSGRVLFHVFSVLSKDLFFKLSFDTENLSWRVEEISDDQTN